MNVAPWLIRAKASPPRTSVAAHPRQLLLDTLVASENRLVTVIEAPAGFGKTTLLSQWRSRLLDADCTVAWLNLDETDEPDVLLPYLALAFELAGVAMEDTGLLNPQYHGDGLSTWRGRLLNKLEAAGGKCLLVLDDAERMPRESVRLVLEPLLRHCPANLRLALAFRHNPGISLSQYAVAQELTVLHAQDLRFSELEIRDWLGGDVDDAGLEALSRSSDGWPVALQLYRGGLLTDSGWMSEQARAAEHYVEEQILAQLDPAEAAFLADVAVLDTVNVQCADAIRGHTDSAHLAAGIHARIEGLFAPLEHADNEYRLHPMIRDKLRLRLPGLDAERYRQLHRRAAHWMAESGHPLTAISHAVAGEEIELAAKVLEHMGAAQLFLREGMSRLRSALTALEDHALVDYPRIQIARAALLAKDGNMQGARSAMELARRQSKNFTEDRKGGSAADLQIDGHLVELLLSEYGCEPSADMMTETAFKEVEDLTADDPPLSALILTWRCLYSTQMGHLDRAFQYGQRAIGEFRKGRSTYGELFIYLHFGQAEMARGRCRSALAEYGKARQIARRDFPGDAGVRRICNIALGEVHWEAGDNSTAQKHLRNVSKQVQHPEAWFDMLMAAYRCSAEFLVESVGVERGVLYLDEARDHTTDQNLYRLTRYINALQFLVLARAGESAEALAFAQRFGRDFDLGHIHPDLRTWRELEVAIQAVSTLAQLEHAPGRAHRFIMDTFQVAQARGINRLAIHCELQSARLYLLENDSANATVSLMKALRWATVERDIRPLLIERQALLPQLEAIVEKAEPEAPMLRTCSDEMRELANAIVCSSHAQFEPAVPTEFSVREAEIIRHLSSGQPDKMIARSVGLSAHGVRYHLKNIYAKLGVQNRTQAINRAQNLGLLGSGPRLP